MDDNFVFSKGKYAGESIKEVKRKNPSYITWAKENAPYLFKDYKIAAPTPKPAQERIEPPETSENKSVIQPNLNFFNEGPNGKQD